MSKVILISSDREIISTFSNKASQKGCQFEHYTEKEWESQNGPPNNLLLFRKNQILPQGQTNWIPPQTSLHEIQFETIKKTLLDMKGNISQVSKTLCIGRATLYRKIKEYDIDIDSIRKSAKKPSALAA